MLASLMFCASFFLRKPPTAFVWDEDAWFPSFRYAEDDVQDNLKKMFKPHLKLFEKIGVDLEKQLTTLTSSKLAQILAQQQTASEDDATNSSVFLSATEKERLEAVMDALREQEKANKLESQINSGVDAASSGAINVLRKLTVSQLVPDTDATSRRILNGAFVYRLIFFFMSVYGLVGLCTVSTHTHCPNIFSRGL